MEFNTPTNPLDHFEQMLHAFLTRRTHAANLQKEGTINVLKPFFILPLNSIP
ncbi:hypothetical protein ABMC88_15235 [Sulfitobacter sp. HNIBRBA2951]|uniref:hypothetical protein n=1 Tax=Sulfitobacter aquimarinus TaxID=3158557 RepID=UPI0032DF58D5